ncbi:MAG TPA: tetratricopeptide repeat protein [Thermoanaerobaculia bacterium]|nr:tetratricopeptide repeat protein [Thermoanaerobaculia bacterium]
MTDRPEAGGDETRTAARSPSLAAGDLLAGRYRIVERLGAGGMGLVYRARDERLSVDVALKVLRPEHGADGEVATRFTRELLLARQVTHRHVVRIHDLGEEGDLAFLTMDLVDGRTLKQVMAEEGKLAPERAVEIARQLAAALAEAHREGVIHRDLKPSNVMIDLDGDAYVTDFGVARSLDGTGLTSTGGVIGTLAYLSPEQAVGDKVDGKSDVFSLGLLLYEMLAGESAYPPGSWSEVIGQRIGGRPESLRRQAPGLPAWLYKTVERCLCTEPHERCDSSELAAALAAGEAPGGAGGTGAGLWRSLRQAITPRRAGWAAVALLAVAAVAAAWWWWPGAGGEAEAGGAVDEPLHSVAVLPFATSGEEADGGSGGAADVLTSALAENRSLQVVDSLRVAETVRALRLPAGQLSEASLAQLADLLDVDRLLTGRLTQVPGRVRFDGRLAAVAPRGLRVEAVSAEGGDLLATLDALAADLRTRLEVAVGDAMAPAPMSDDPRAVAAYSDGMALLQKGDSVAAAPLLTRATELDPDFAAAWLRLGSAYEALGFYGDAEDALHRAVEVLPTESGRLGFEARARLAAFEGDGERAVALLEQLAESYPHDNAARVALAEEYEALGRFDDAISTLEAVVANDANHPKAWYLLGRNAIRSGDPGRAVEDYLVRARVVQNRLRNPQGQGEVANALGVAQMNLGELEAALASFEEAAELWGGAGDRRGVASTLENLGSVELQRGDHQAAKRRYEEALAIRREIGDLPGVAGAYNWLGVLEEEQGRYRAALGLYRQALELRRDLGDENDHAESLNNVGFAYFLLGELDNASAYWDDAMELFEKAGNPEGILLVRQNLGLLAVVRGDWQTALNHFVETLNASRDLGLPFAEAVSLGNLGHVAQLQGRYAAALDNYADALERVGELEDPRGLVEYNLLAADATREVGLLAESERHLAAAERWLGEGGGNHEQRSMHARLVAELELVRGREAEATDDLDLARREAEESDSRVQRLFADLATARHAVASGDAERGARLAAEVAAEGRSVGHLALEVDALGVAATARLAAGDAAGAVADANRALRLARQHAPYGSAYRLHRIHALALESAGTGEPARAWSAAAAEVERLRAELDGDALDAFERLPEVSEILRHASDDRRPAG